MLSPEAIKHDLESGYNLIPLTEIYADPDFNCRGHFTATDVIELANDIAIKGLMTPVIVRPLWPNEAHLAKRGFKYSLVAGFRRYTSYRVNSATVIPGKVEDIKDEFTARDINARENLQRKDLTLWQECQTIRHYWIADWGREQIAQRVGKSPGWVQIRVMLLEMEPEIQEYANQNLLTVEDIRNLHKFKGKERLVRAGRIRDARKAGETKAVKIMVKKPDKPNTKKARKVTQVQDMMEHLRETFDKSDRTLSIPVDKLVSNQGNMFVHRVLAWVTGEITTMDLHLSIRNQCELFGINYQMPEFDMGDT